jgi:YhcH/YjgK/YiaL family protein
MVVTDLEHVAEQVNMTPAMKKAVDFLKAARGKELADGRVDIDGDRVYALVQSYDTISTDQPKFEGHRKYIDVQCVMSGEEVIGWAMIENATATTPYSEEKDVWLGTVPADRMTPVRLSAAQAAVLYPSDAHAPRLAAKKPSFVKKIVVKVAVE